MRVFPAVLHPLPHHCRPHRDDRARVELFFRLDFPAGMDSDAAERWRDVFMEKVGRRRPALDEARFEAPDRLRITTAAENLPGVAAALRSAVSSTNARILKDFEREIGDQRALDALVARHLDGPIGPDPTP